MTQSEQKVKILEAVKLRPGISNISDTLLSDFISDVFNDISQYINLIEGAEMPQGCISIVKDLVVIKCNKLGSESVSSESHEGISQSYIEDIPKDVKSRLRRYRRLPL
ncbi:phage head-tail connector protein [Clostridium cadaveris]|uniref:phage head-tail connector protein n=1 Tax=Clostridium cadaveris TaxID=1529 RepID=UPI0025A37AF7|nr:phage head-tail connector protein [Clostridium cadaveris]MDM8312903.1 phage head-tail connector protein [Clostridium cadaveris]